MLSFHPQLNFLIIRWKNEETSSPVGLHSVALANVIGVMKKKNVEYHH